MKENAMCGKKFFAFGGASSHDIQDGILEPSDYKTFQDLVDDYNKRTNCGEMLRVNHILWWKEEMPSKAEMDFGLETLKANEYKVDYIISHCCPQSIASIFSHGLYKPDELTKYFDTVANKTTFDKWICGHYHRNDKILDKYYILYGDFMRIE